MSSLCRRCAANALPDTTSRRYGCFFDFVRWQITTFRGVGGAVVVVVVDAVVVVVVTFVDVVVEVLTEVEPVEVVELEDDWSARVGAALPMPEAA